RRRVRRLRLHGMGLVDGDVAGRAVGLAGGRVDHAIHACRTAGVEDVLGADHVGLDVALGRLVAVGDPDEGGQMEHDLGTLHRPPHTAPVAHVTLQDLDVVLAALEPAQAPRGRVVDQGPDLGPLPQEALDEVAPDEAFATGDEHPAPGQVGHGGYSSSPTANWWSTCSNSAGLPMSNHFSRIGNTCTGRPSARTAAMRSGMPVCVLGGTKRSTSGGSM